MPLRFELAAVAKHFEGRKGVLFPAPGGHAMPVVSRIVSNRGWIAEAMGVSSAGMIARFEAAAANPLPCRVVDEAPVQEVVHGRVDLGAQLPLPTHNELDSGPYITAGLVVPATLGTVRRTSRSCGCSSTAPTGSAR